MQNKNKLGPKFYYKKLEFIDHIDHIYQISFYCLNCLNLNTSKYEHKIVHRLNVSQCLTSDDVRNFLQEVQRKRKDKEEEKRERKKAKKLKKQQQEEEKIIKDAEREFKTKRIKRTFKNSKTGAVKKEAR